MRSTATGSDVTTTCEPAELVLGIDVELFAGVAGESPNDRRVRLPVARAILAELSEQDPKDARFVRSLMSRSTRRHLTERRAA
jgi:hypothetical protein